MPVTKSGFVLRRGFRGCMKLCKGFRGRVGDKSKDFGRCVATCLQVAQSGQRSGFTMIPKQGASPVATACRKATSSCLRRALKLRLRVPKTRDKLHGATATPRRRRSAKRSRSKTMNS